MNDSTGRGMRGTGQSALGGAVAYLLGAKVLGWGEDALAMTSLTVLFASAVTWAQVTLERLCHVRGLWRTERSIEA